MRSPVSSASALAVVLLLLVSSQSRSAETLRDLAWAILQANWNENGTEKRVQAVRVLALLPGDLRALALAKKAASDETAEVRAAAATDRSPSKVPASGAAGGVVIAPALPFSLVIEALNNRALTLRAYIKCSRCKSTSCSQC